MSQYRERPECKTSKHSAPVWGLYTNWTRCKSHDRIWGQRNSAKVTLHSGKIDTLPHLDTAGGSATVNHIEKDRCRSWETEASSANAMSLKFVQTTNLQKFFSALFYYIEYFSMFWVFLCKNNVINISISEHVTNITSAQSTTTRHFVIIFLWARQETWETPNGCDSTFSPPPPPPTLMTCNVRPGDP